MTPVGFEPTQLALVELESTPLDRSGKVSLTTVSILRHNIYTIVFANFVLQVNKFATGTRTRVARVRAEYPNQLDYSGVDIVAGGLWSAN